MIGCQINRGGRLPMLVFTSFTSTVFNLLQNGCAFKPLCASTALMLLNEQLCRSWLQTPSQNVFSNNLKLRRMAWFGTGRLQLFSSVSIGENVLTGATFFQKKATFSAVSSSWSSAPTTDLLMFRAFCWLVHLFLNLVTLTIRLI